jgi:hypothetical protein
MDATRLRPDDRSTLVCGGAGLLIMVLFTISNFALGDWNPPKPTASADEISRFFLDHGPTLAWAVGMRYGVFLLLPIFLFGVARFVAGDSGLARSLGVIALVGAAWLVATGTVANTLESILIFERDDLASQADLARLAAIGMNAFFDVAVLPHALVIFCLSEAGRRTRALPGWLVALGYFQAATGVIGGVALVAALHHGTFWNLTFGLSFFAFALWYLAAAVILVSAGLRGVARRRETAPR